MDKNDGPDTIALEEDEPHWAETQADDVFDPAVRVTLAWRDLETAVERGAVVPAQAHALWAGWASQSGPHRVVPPAPAAAAVVAAKSVAYEALLPPVAPAREGSSAGVLLGFTLAAALAGALLSYALFAM
jgi:hypothetical protein